MDLTSTAHTDVFLSDGTLRLTPASMTTSRAATPRGSTASSNADELSADRAISSESQVALRPHGILHGHRFPIGR